MTWIATTGHIHDALKRITADHEVKLILFCGPGVDPHGFSPAMSDVRAMESADAIFFNGFHLEAKLIDLLHDSLRGQVLGNGLGVPRRSTVGLGRKWHD